MTGKRQYNNNKTLNDMKSKEDIANVLLDRAPVFFFFTATCNLPTSVTTISTKCVFYKRIMFQTVGQCAVGYISAERSASETRKLVVRKNLRVNFMGLPNK